MGSLRSCCPRGVKPPATLAAPAIVVALCATMPPPRHAAAQPSSTSAPAAYTETIPGTSVRFDMVSIPGGTFTIGSAASESARSAEEGPQQSVVIPPFWMEKTEVTWDEFDAFRLSQGVGRPGSQPTPTDADAITRPTPPYADESFGFGKGRQPVISVQHHAAMEYARWLSAKTGHAYRLPTEAEWEYAARAGTTTAYSFGNDAGKLGQYAWYAGNSGGRPHPVGGRMPNPWGLFDMHGNVAEWCVDQYDASAYRRLTAGTIGPVLLPTEARYPHAARGGSWDDDARRLRSAARRASSRDWNRRDPQSPQSIWWFTDATFVGFRVVRAVEEQENLKGLRSKITTESR